MGEDGNDQWHGHMALWPQELTVVLVLAVSISIMGTMTDHVSGCHEVSVVWRVAWSTWGQQHCSSGSASPVHTGLQSPPLCVYQAWPPQYHGLCWVLTSALCFGDSSPSRVVMLRL